MKKKLLSIVLAITMIGTPVYGAEFYDEEKEEQTPIESAENTDEKKQVETEELNEEIGTEDISDDTNETFSGVAEAEKKVSKLEIVKLPEKTTFTFPFEDYYDEDNEEGTVDLKGLTIKITYTDGTEKQEVLNDGLEIDELGETYEGDWHFSEYEYEYGITLYEYNINITIEHKDDDYDEDRQILKPGKYAISVVYQEDTKISCKYQDAISIEVQDCPSLVKNGEKYSKTVKGDEKDLEFVKFTPDISGKYILSSREGDSKTQNALQNIFDNRMQQVSHESREGGSLCELKKGETYYLQFYTYYWNDVEVTISAEKFAEITSIKLSESLNPEPLYISVDVDDNDVAWDDSDVEWNKGKWDVSYCWSGKINVTYSDGYSESLYLWDTNRYGQKFKCYIPSKNRPTVGNHNVHITFYGTEAEEIIKNVSIKEDSEMPTINVRGQKTVFVRSLARCVYVRLKTGSQTEYKINLKLPFEYDYLPGYKHMVIKSEDQKESFWLNNGDTVTLKPNTVYFISGVLGGLWTKALNATFIVTSEIDGSVEIEPSITLNNDSGILAAELNTIDNIIEHGFVYGKETDVTLDTPGRTRVAYSEFDSDKSYSFDTTDLTGCAIRAYVIYIDKNGNEQTVYSNIYSR